MLRFTLLKSKADGKERKFAFGGLRVDARHLTNRRKMEGIKNSDPPVFVVPRFDHTVLSDWVRRQLDVPLESKSITILIGGKKTEHQVDSATLSYMVVDDAQRVSSVITAEVHFSSELVRRLVKHFSKQVEKDPLCADLLDEASGIISWEHLEKHGLGRPKIDPAETHVVLLQKPPEGV